MEDVFARIVLGHLTADYLLQNKRTALTKSEKGLRGTICCAVHCAVYATAVCFFLFRFDLIFFVLFFLSHYPIDRWSLAEKWLRMIRGRNLKEAFESKDKYREFDIAFSCIVYAVADNTMHLVLLWLMLKCV
jgi:hypothetical protein